MGGGGHCPTYLTRSLRWSKPCKKSFENLKWADNIITEQNDLHTMLSDYCDPLIEVEQVRSQLARDH